MKSNVLKLRKIIIKSISPISLQGVLVLYLMRPAYYNV
jgi:hypothetical protein